MNKPMAAPHLDEYLTPKEAAALLKLHPFTLAKWRMADIGPNYCKFGRHIRYPKKELAAWVAANRVECDVPAA